MNELRVTVTGWVATDPILRITNAGTKITSFRLASTARYFDRNAGTWQDRSTEWFTVTLYREAATLITESIKKGQPVVVQGRLRTDTWTAKDEPRTDLVLDAEAVGHDLTKGVATFTRAIVETHQGTSEDESDETADASASVTADAEEEELESARSA